MDIVSVIIVPAVVIGALAFALAAIARRVYPIASDPKERAWDDAITQQFAASRKRPSRNGGVR